MINWIRKLFSNSTLANPGEWLTDALTLKSAAGRVVTRETALQVAAVHACVRVISESIAQLPLNVYRRTDNDGREIDRQHPLHNLLHDMPNPEQTAFDLHHYIVSRVLLSGNAYTQIVRTRGGKIAELVPLTGRVQVDRDSANKLHYVHSTLGGNTETFRADQVWRVSGGPSADGITGHSPMRSMRESIGLSLATEEYAARLFSHGAIVPMVLESPEGLSDRAYERLKEDLEKNHGGTVNAHKTMLLEEGLTLKAIGLSSKDSQSLEARKHQNIEIARWYGVPPHMIGELDRATFSNIEHQSIQFLQYTITPRIVNYRQTIWRDLLTTHDRQTHFVDFVTDGLVRADIKARNEAYAIAVTNGWLNRNEVRALMNRNWIEGLDEFLSPANMTTDAERQAGSDETQNRLRRLVTNGHRRVTSKESQALKAAFKKYNGAGFDAWLNDFFRDHVDRIVEETGTGRVVAIQYCRDQRAAISSGGWSRALSDSLLEVALNEI